jgi:cytochrome c peroxidase
MVGLSVLSLVLLAVQVGCQPTDTEPATPTDDAAVDATDDTAGDVPAVTPDESATDTADDANVPMLDEPAADQTAAATMQIDVPLGLPPVPVPDDNPMTAEKVELGKLLYFDPRLSVDGTISCATCHDPQMAWAEHTPTSTGVGDQVGGANSPTVINTAYADSLFWDGRSESLEDQALGPMENPIEMAHSLTNLVQELNQIQGYKDRFQKVFGTDVTAEGMAQAIAAFERTILSGNAPYDKYTAGDENALTDAQKRGMQKFEDAGCSTCHTPPVFSNFRFYNAGIGMDKDTPDEGRKAVTGNDSDLGKFRVPALREVANTHPYFHDGSVETLEEAVAAMASGGIENSNLSPVIKAVGSQNLTEQDQQDIVEFLKALSGEYPIMEAPELP